MPAADRRGAGYVGQITANSFMKREFGKKLIEEFFAQKVTDPRHRYSGAYIPGHGTPTVILVGRNMIADRHDRSGRCLASAANRAARDDPAKGLVWQAIVDQIDRPGSESEWVTR